MPTVLAWYFLLCSVPEPVTLADADRFAPTAVIEVLMHANLEAQRFARMQQEWCRHSWAVWWEIELELKRIHLCYEMVVEVRRFYGSDEERLYKLGVLRKEIGPGFWRCGTLPRPIPDSWLFLFRDVPLGVAEQLPPPMFSVP